MIIDIADCEDFRSDEFRQIMQDQYPNFGLDWFYRIDEQTRTAIVEKIKELPVAIEIETDGAPVVVLHGDIPKDSWEATKQAINDNDEKVISNIINTSMKLENSNGADIADAARVFFGHTVRTMPVNLGNCFYIDTGGVFTVQGKSTSHFITIAEINANKEDICSPQQITRVPTVRVALAKDNPLFNKL